MYQLLGIFAEFELTNLRQRTRAGLKQVKKNGVVLVRLPIPMDKQEEIIRLYQMNGLPIENIAKRLKLSESSIYRVARHLVLSRRYPQELLLILKN